VTDPPRWPVNPRVHERFADRAKEEAERRSMVRAVMARLPKKGTEVEEVSPLSLAGVRGK
jgi:hypothetical protein